MMKQNDTINKVAELLDRFLQGQTTEAEEQQLTDYFCHADEIPEEWSLYKDVPELPYRCLQFLFRGDRWPVD